MPFFWGGAAVLLWRKGWCFFSWQYKFYFCRLQAVLATLEFFFL